MMFQVLPVSSIHSCCLFRTTKRIWWILSIINFIKQNFLGRLNDPKKNDTNHPLVLQIPKKTLKSRPKYTLRRVITRSTRDQMFFCKFSGDDSTSHHHHCWVCWPEARDDETEHGWHPASRGVGETSWWLVSTPLKKYANVKMDHFLKKKVWK